MSNASASNPPNINADWFSLAHAFKNLILLSQLVGCEVPGLTETGAEAGCRMMGVANTAGVLNGVGATGETGPAVPGEDVGGATDGFGGSGRFCVGELPLLPGSGGDPGRLRGVDVLPRSACAFRFCSASDSTTLRGAGLLLRRVGALPFAEFSRGEAG